MIFFWLIYFLISFLISFFLIKLFDNRFIKIIAFSLSFALMMSVWFRVPGESFLAPILSIFFLESTILEDHGLSRIFRPFLITTFFLVIISYLLIKRKSKN